MNQPSVRWSRVRQMFPSDRSDSIRTKGSNKLQHIVWLWIKRLFCHVSVNRWELVSLLHTCLMKQTCKVLFCFDSARKSLFFYIPKSEGSYYSTLCSLSKLPRKPKYNLKKTNRMHTHADTHWEEWMEGVDGGVAAQHCWQRLLYFPSVTGLN